MCLAPYLPGCMVFEIAVEFVALHHHCCPLTSKTAIGPIAIYCCIHRQSCRPLPHPLSLYLAVEVTFRHRHC
jgi:hypothetical protein